MSRSTKTWLAIAICLTVIGALVFLLALAELSFDFNKLATEEYRINTYDIDGEFDKISIDVDTADIRFVLRGDERARVEVHETEKIKHSATVEDGVLKISVEDTRKWYEYIGISFGNMALTVYLPGDNELAAVTVDTDTGDVEIPKTLETSELTVSTDTGDIVCYGSVSDILSLETDTGDITLEALLNAKIELSTDTGDIKVKDVISAGAMDIETDTGRIDLEHVYCNSITAVSSTGRQSYKDVLTDDSFNCTSNTGDVTFEGCDAAELYIETNTGDVSGSLLTKKIFTVETSTGDINVPETVSGGKCKIITDTGDVDMYIA